MQTKQTILFDLDGTLLDTAPDLAYALNILRRANNMPELPLDMIKPTVGHGSKSMLKLGFNVDESHEHYPVLQEAFFNTYDTCLTRETALFPGIAEVLQHLDDKNIRWGIVTNKPARFTHLILDALNLSKRSACTVCGDTLAERKPHPAPILYACKLLECHPSDTLYVGDAATDIIASKAAGARSVAALYGYIGTEEDPYSWQADGYAHSPADIMKWIRD